MEDDEWTTELDEWMLLALSKGLSDIKIAGKIGRPLVGVQDRLHTLRQSGPSPPPPPSSPPTPKPAKKTKPAYYAVVHGRTPGIFESWKECTKSIYRFPGSSYKKFDTLVEAQQHIEQTPHTVAPQKTATRARPIDTRLNTDQQKAIDVLESGANLFLTGPPGTGKSYTIIHILSQCHQANRCVAITALTGAAAVLLRGFTLHSFLGIGLGKGTSEYLAGQIKSQRKKKIKRLDLLIIDEISMMDTVLLEKVSEVMSIVRDNTQPFGGVQVILCGDFCQLPPVQGSYCFLSPEWTRAQSIKVELTRNHRQENDMTLQDMLLELRWGRCSKETAAKLASLRTTVFPEGIEPTRLYSLRADTDAINESEFAKLVVASGDTAKEFNPDFPSDPMSQIKAVNWCKSMGTPLILPIVPAAQVVLTYNMDQNKGLVNGSRGVVVSVHHPTHVVVRFINGVTTDVSYQTQVDGENKNIWISYLPLKLAYALTIHKSQGMTLDAMEVDLGSSIFECGQAYTALSRAKSLESVRVVDIKPSSFRTDPRVIKFLSD